MGWLFPDTTCKQCKQHAELHNKGWLASLGDTEECKQCKQHAEFGCEAASALQKTP